MTKNELNDLLLKICALILELDYRELDPEEEVTNWGIDSVNAAMIHDLIETRLIRKGCDFSYNEFISHATIDELSETLIQNKMLGSEKPTLEMIHTPVGGKSVKKPGAPINKTAPETHRFQELGFSTPGHKTVFQGMPVVSFASNDYLSLATDPGVHAAIARGAREYGTGCGSSMIGSGALKIHAQLAEELAGFLGKEAVLLMPGGYMTMLGFCASQIISGHTLYSDALNHRSIIDGLRLGKGASERKDAFHFFNHNSTTSLKQIRGVIGGAKDPKLPDIVVMEGVYSMDGDRCNLEEFVPYCKAQGMRIAIDDAHGMGVLGNHGRGTADAAGKSKDVDYILGTFSKSFAAAGGFIAGTEAAVDEIRQQCSQYMFSASLAPPVVEAIRYILRLMQTDNRRQERLWENITYLKSCFSELGIETMDCNSAIVPVMVRQEEKAYDCARKLVDQKKIFVLPVVYPVVPRGKARLRISVNTGHSREDIANLAESLAEILG